MRLQEVDVWLDIGRGGRLFTYTDSKGLGVELGDIVLVKLRGRSVRGLVANQRKIDLSVEKESAAKSKTIALLEIESIVQKAAFENGWQEWLRIASEKCHVSSFQMIKTALPSSWLNCRKSRNMEVKKYWWVTLNNDIDANKKISKKQKELIKYLLNLRGGSWQKDLQARGFSAGIIRMALNSSLISREKRSYLDSEVLNYTVSRSADIPLETPRELTDDQKHALDVFDSQPKGSVFLLWGITGSGKTEVYLHMVANELSENKSCLVLAPEIGLIPQLVDRFKRRFGVQVFEYHSGCSEKERITVWQRVLNTSKPVVVVGTRSSIFLPLDPLGLIVLDEEHDTSYKQEHPMPCYHARELACQRANKTGARVVLGSATPSLSTWKNLAPHGPIAYARLSRRIENRPLPNVYVIDMRQELAAGNRRLISRVLIDRLSLLPELNEQAIILVPRRGYNSFLSCRSCGDVIQCPHCDVSLTVHKSSNSNQWLRCHWCDYQVQLGFECKECGSKAFKPFGAGTQRVIEHLSNELKDLKFLRFDRDTTGGRDGHRQLLEKFSSGEADVLVGTQMLSKGIDLPRVTMAVVLAADGLLHRPDLLAGEQSLQLFMQLAGRAGRGQLPGKVYVQTYSPEHPVIRHLVDGTYEKFLTEESRLRKEAGLVPYRRACLIRLSSESPALTETAAMEIADYIRRFCNAEEWSLVGPAPALIERIAGKSRWQILLHGPPSSPLPLPKIEELWKYLPNGVNISINPDPVNL